jgi:hypothetical protein
MSDTKNYEQIIESESDPDGLTSIDSLVLSSSSLQGINVT